MLYRLFASLMVVAAVTPLGSAGWLRPNEMTIGGGVSTSEGLSVLGMSLWVRRDEPAVAFGMVKGPATSQEYSYVLLVKGDPKRQKLAGYNSTSTSDGQTAAGGGFVEIKGVRADVAYSVKLVPTGWIETVTIGGQPFDLGQGRVFLVDLSGKAATVEQVNADLPRNPVTPKTTEDVDLLARGHVKLLRKQSAAVRTFLK